MPRIGLRREAGSQEQKPGANPPTPLVVFKKTIPPPGTPLTERASAGKHEQNVARSSES